MVIVGHLTDAEKKMKKKAKKAAQKTQEDPKKAATSANEDKGLEAPAPKDDDPDGTKLLASHEGLEIAAKLLQPLVNLELPSIRIWVTIYDVAVRRSEMTKYFYRMNCYSTATERYLQAIKALLHASTLDPGDPELHVRLVEIRKICRHGNDPFVQLLTHGRVYSAPAAPSTHRTNSFGYPGGSAAIVNKP